MKRYKIFIAPRAAQEIQNGIDYYNEKRKGLGKKFLLNINKTIEAVRQSPFYQIRYDDVRCLLVKGFPYMVHFTIDEKREDIYVHAVIHTSLNPDENWLKNE